MAALPEDFGHCPEETDDTNDVFKGSSAKGLLTVRVAKYPNGIPNWFHLDGKYTSTELGFTVVLPRLLPGLRPENPELRLEAAQDLGSTIMLSISEV